MPRIFHTMLRVGDLQRSINFYTNCLGMTLLRTEDVKEEEFTLAFLGYTTEADGPVIELTYNYGVTKYEMGKAYGHVALGVDDVPATVARLKEMGVNILYLADDAFMAFIEDPDGYQIELLNEKRMVEHARGKTTGKPPATVSVPPAAEQKS